MLASVEHTHMHARTINIKKYEYLRFVYYPAAKQHAAEQLIRLAPHARHHSIILHVRACVVHNFPVNLRMHVALFVPCNRTGKQSVRIRFDRAEEDMRVELETRRPSVTQTLCPILHKL